MVEKEILALRRRILPSNDYDIASSMNNLAASYSKLGRHNEAVQLQEETLEFFKRALPPGKFAV